MAPKHKRGYTGNSDMPKRGWEFQLPLSEKVKVLNLIRKEKTHLLRLLRSMVRKSLPPMKLWRRKKKSLLALLLHLKLQKSQPQCLSASLRWKRHFICARYFERAHIHVTLITIHYYSWKQNSYSKANQGKCEQMLSLLSWPPLSPLVWIVYLFYVSTKTPIGRNTCSPIKGNILLASTR